MMYSTILGRKADESGKDYWVNLLNYTNTREHVFNGFLLSSEFAGQCQDAEIGVGSQIYEPDAEQLWQYNIQILELCDVERQKEGLEKLATREDLWRDVACLRANELPTSFSHTRPNGSSCFTAYSEAGIRYSGAGENIGAGYQTPADAVNGWMNSSGHRRNILDSGFRYLATGYAYTSSGQYKHYYCQNFMK